MRLFIAEKSELALAVVEGLGGGERKGGIYYCANDDRVVPCRGHLLELMEPHDYDPELEKWSLAPLPWSAMPWKKKPVADTADLLKNIIGQLGQASSVVHVGDPDDEGQLIVDEILEYARYNGPVQRLLINDNNVKVVQRSLANMRDNRELAGLSASAEARSVGDLLYGVNITRAYTLVAQAKGYDGVLHVGRVQTPILGMVERRCRENAHHKSAFYYLVNGKFAIGNVVFPARYQTTDTDPVDDKKRLVDKDRADAIVAAIGGQNASIESAATKAKQTPAPLPYNLIKLQSDTSRLFGLMPDRVLAITQDLRVKHKLITYNRSDCQFLNEEQHADAPEVLAAVAGTCPQFKPLVDKADPTFKSRAFDSSKTSAHHGIVPTGAVVPFADLTKDEQRIYMLIARAYIAQFWPVQRYDQTTVVVAVGERRFAVKSNITTDAGWRQLYQAEQAAADDGDDDDDALSTDLRGLTTGATGRCEGGERKDMKTKPLPLYTIATLLEDLTRVAKYVREERLRKILIERDKGKEGEHGGIGTPATRDAIIKNLFERGWLETQGKHVVTTRKASEFYDVLPNTARYPDMTALWQEQQTVIAKGERTALSFVEELVAWLGAEIERVKSQGLNIKVNTQPCPVCGGPMARRQGEHGFFWACLDREGCKTIARDKDGRPVPKEEVSVSALHHCMACGKGLIRRAGSATVKGQRPRPPWWSCSGYPTCKQRYSDKDGKPDFSTGRASS
jgi:Topoisomerase IA